MVGETYLSTIAQRSSRLLFHVCTQWWLVLAWVGIPMCTSWFKQCCKRLSRRTSGKCQWRNLSFGFFAFSFTGLIQLPARTGLSSMLTAFTCWLPSTTQVFLGITSKFWNFHLSRLVAIYSPQVHRLFVSYVFCFQMYSDTKCPRIRTAGISNTGLFWRLWKTRQG